MTIKMTIEDEDWTVLGFIGGWADDPTTTAQEAQLSADSQIAYLLNHTREIMPGWSFARGAFSGPNRKNAVDEIHSLLIASVDYVIERLDEIKAEAAELA